MSLFVLKKVNECTTNLSSNLSNFCTGKLLGSKSVIWLFFRTKDSKLEKLRKAPFRTSLMPHDSNERWVMNLAFSRSLKMYSVILFRFENPLRVNCCRPFRKENVEIGMAAKLLEEMSKLFKVVSCLESVWKEETLTSVPFVFLLKFADQYGQYANPGRNYLPLERVFQDVA